MAPNARLFAIVLTPMIFVACSPSPQHAIKVCHANAIAKGRGRSIPHSDIQKGAIERLEKRGAEIRNSRKSITISQLLGIEGDCAAAYYRTWHGIPLKWSGLKHRPIPENWLEISPRTMTWRRKARAARHPVNAMLNYGYGILAHQIKSQIIAAGLDPTIGIIHGNSQNPIPLVYDVMEPIRPVVDQKILEFAMANTFAPGDFTITKWGGCRLNPHLAKTVAKQVTALNNEDIVDCLLRGLKKRDAHRVLKFADVIVNDAFG
jgi:CRISPR-associated endonuclease Cas1